MRDKHRRARLFFFFFQAEDGIRDVAVTGVQTCALPISSRFLRRSCSSVDVRAYRREPAIPIGRMRSEEHTSELQSRLHLVCRLLLEKKKKNTYVTVDIILSSRLER